MSLVLVRGVIYRVRSKKSNSYIAKLSRRVKDNVDSELKEIFVSALLFSKYNPQTVGNVQYQILNFLESTIFIWFPALFYYFLSGCLFRFRNPTLIKSFFSWISSK